MFREILRFELRQQLASPFYWLVVLAFAAIALTAAGSDSITIGGGIGNVLRNAPSVVITMLTMFTLLGLFLTTVFIGAAALRDFEAGTAELLFATPMPRRAWLLGRFGAGYLASVGVLAGVALGLMAVAWMPWVDPARLGPTRLDAYAWAFGVMVLPNLFFSGALLFALAAFTRSMLRTYLGVIAFFVFWQVAFLAAGKLEHQTLGALIDPFGIETFGLLTRYWTAADANTRLPVMDGLFLANRLLWMGMGVLLLGLTLAFFRPERQSRSRRGHGGDAPASAASSADAGTQPPPVVHLRSDAASRWRQWLHLARFETRAVLAGAPFLVMLLFGLLNLAGGLFYGSSSYGTPVYPVTRIMLQVIAGSYNWLLILIVAFYAGELVWRDREARVAAVADAMPSPDWLPLAARFAALVAVIVAFLAVADLAAIVNQLIVGGVAIEPGLYLSDLALEALGFALLAALFVFFQAISPGKFTGYLLTVAWMVSGIVLGELHFEHHLYDYASAPEARYSDMNGYGHFLAAHLWFRGYWALLAAALLVIAALYWPRGVLEGFRVRTRLARRRAGRPARLALAASLAGFVAVGSFLWWQTTVVNRYEPKDVAERRQADYERKYRQYLDLPQPKISDVKVEMDIFPERREVAIRGHYLLVNRSDGPIRDLHVLLAREMELEDFRFPAHELVTDDEPLGYRIYRLAEPLAPGATMPFDFTIRYRSRGIRNSPDDFRVVGNGTFIDNSLFPRFGYHTEGELGDRNERRKHGLPERARMASRDDAAARQFHLLGRDADWVNFEATVSTAADQTAIAPGYLEREWTEGDRRYFHYRMDKPILNFFSFQSARYAVARDEWNGIALEVYHDPKHAWNVPRMIEAAKKSLAHYSEAYAPYQFRQLRILEFPGYRAFAQSFANTVPYSEGIGFIADLRDPDAIDYVFYVTAHEVAHQWWGHQVVGAAVQGATMLIETFAQYSALMVQEAEYGPQKMRRFLRYELDRYLSGRSGEEAEELPLALNENQPYIHYRKGSVVMYALKDYLGEDTVDRVLQRWRDRFAFAGPPYSTTRDWLAELRAEAGPQWETLIEDLFEKITVLDNRVREARARELPDGRWEVTLDLHAAKVHVDGVGNETPAPLGEPLDIGVFARGADGKEASEKVLYLAKHKVPDGDSSLTVIVDQKPWEAGIDPYNKRIDRLSLDNRKRVSFD